MVGHTIIYTVNGILNILTSPFEKVGRITYFAGGATKDIFVAPFFIRQFIIQLQIITSQCLFPVVAVVTAFGMVVALQGANIFKIFGAQQMLSSLLAISLIRELAPSITSIMVAAQAGSSITAEIGAMRIKEEIDALEVMAVPPVKYLVIPRILATGLACAFVNSIALVTGIFGGYIVAVFVKGISHGAFMDNLFMFTNSLDIYMSLIKATTYGLIVGLTSCYYGYYVTGGANGLGRAVNNAVVHSILFFIFLNYVLTTLFFNLSGLLSFQ